MNFCNEFNKFLFYIEAQKRHLHLFYTFQFDAIKNKLIWDFIILVNHKHKIQLKVCAVACYCKYLSIILSFLWFFMDKMN